MLWHEREREKMNYSTILLWISFVWTCFHLLNCAARLRFKSSQSPRELPPGPFPLPIVGNLFKLGKEPHKSLAELAKTYGSLMTLKLGSVTTIVVSSASMAKEILQNNDLDFSSRSIPANVRSLHIHHEYSMVWLPVSPAWRKLRKICNSHIFTPQRLNANQGIRHQKVNDLLTFIHEKSKSGHAVNIGQAAFVTTLNLLSNTMFSIDMAHLNSESVQEFKTLVSGVMEELGRPNLLDYFPVLRFIDPQGARGCLKTYFMKIDELFDEIINQRMGHNNLLDILLNLSQEKNLEFSHHHLKALLKDIFIAGTDTSSSTLEWAMTELLRHPKVMEKARMELKETINKDKIVEESDIARLPYLQAIIKETLRLHPPAPFLIPHKAETDVEISGFTVPKCAQVLVNVWTIGRDPDIWVKPTSFRPDRFLGSSVDIKGRDFELIPFGAGRRLCPGLPLAYRMVHLMLASLLYSFDWKLEDGMKPEDMDMQEKFGITLQKAYPLRAFPIQV